MIDLTTIFKPIGWLIKEYTKVRKSSYFTARDQKQKSNSQLISVACWLFCLRPRHVKPGCSSLPLQRPTRRSSPEKNTVVHMFTLLQLLHHGKFAGISLQDNHRIEIITE